MNKFKVKFTNNSEEEIEAAQFAVDKENNWIEFSDGRGTVALVQSAKVSRIDRVN